MIDLVRRIKYIERRIFNCVFNCVVGCTSSEGVIKLRIRLKCYSGGSVLINYGNKFP